MSTPSTAAVLPPPYPHYNSHRNHLLGSHPHLTNGHSYSTSSASSGPITNGIYTHPVSQSSTTTMGSRTVQGPQSTGGRPRKPPVDWNEFYKNGIPKEIIIIDDSESPPPSSSTKRTARMIPSSQSSVNNVARHADKKRRTTNASTYEPVYPNITYPAPQTPLTAGHGSPTVTASSSTAGRNSSTLISTAPTSAGSSGAGSSSTLAYPMSSGTKRKRMTRSTVAAAVAAASGDIYGGYHPPPKPPIKAKEVFVRTIADVCAHICTSLNLCEVLIFFNYLERIFENRKG